MGPRAVGAIVKGLGDNVRIADQRLIQRWWIDYAGDEPPTNTLLREFYIVVVRPSDLYYYGIVFEVFDLITNDFCEQSERSGDRRRSRVNEADTTDTAHEEAAA